MPGGPGQDRQGGKGRGALTLPGRRYAYLAFLLFLLCGGHPAAEELLADRWQIVLLGGQQVGDLHVRSFAQGDGRVRTEMYQSMALRRFGEVFTVSQRDIWLESDRLESVETLLLMNGQRQEVSAEHRADGLAVRQSQGGRSVERLIPAREPVLGVYTAGQRVEEAVAVAVAAAGTGGAAAQPAAEGRSLRFQLFSPETGAVLQVEVAILGPGELVDSRGNVHRGVLVEQRSSALPGIVTREVYAEDGAFLYSVSDIGVPLELVGLEEAGERAAADLELFDVVAFAIPVAGLPARAGALCAVERVRLRFRGEGSAVLAEALESSQGDLGGRGPRVVERQAGPSGQVEGLLVEVDSPRAPERLEPAAAVELDAGPGAYLRDGFHLGLEDPRLQALLERCPTREAECLERAVDRFLARKSLGRGFAGLTEILDSREGDCTEHALLLAALLRKSGVPARLAYGLLLTEAGLIGHAWTEAWQGGRWHWLDPSFPGGAPYGLKLRLGTLDPGEPVWGQLGAGLLTLRSSVRAELLSPGLGPPAGEPVP